HSPAECRWAHETGMSATSELHEWNFILCAPTHEIKRASFRAVQTGCSCKCPPKIRAASTRADAQYGFVAAGSVPCFQGRNRAAFPASTRINPHLTGRVRYI